MADADQSNLTTLTVDLLSAYVANNTVEHGAIPDLIKSTHAALKVIDTGESPASEEPEYKAAVSLRKSLGSPNHIISMIDGKPYQTLKRHLSKHDLTPDQYRQRYGLAKTYPMVAPAYSESRRAIAKRLGLGKRMKGAQEQAATTLAASEIPAPTKPGEKSPTATKIPAVDKASAAVRTSAASKAGRAKPAKPRASAKATSPAKPKAPSKAETVEAAAITVPMKAALSAKKERAAKLAVAPPLAEKANPAPRKGVPKAEPLAS